MSTEKPKTNVVKKRKALTLDFDAVVVTPDHLKRAVSAFVELIKAVSADVAGNGKRVQWDMTVGTGSRLVIARPVADPETIRDAEIVLSVLPEGLKRLEKGTEVFPAHFDEKALKAARELASLPVEGKGFKYVRVRSTGKGKKIGDRAISSIDRLLGGQHQALGSIEGTLSTLTERGSLQLVVYDSLYDRGVNCFVTEDAVLQAAVKAFRKRVAVTGMVQYDKESRPVSIRVDHIREFKDVSELPPIKNLRGIFLRAE